MMKTSIKNIVQHIFLTLALPLICISSANSANKISNIAFDKSANIIQFQSSQKPKYRFFTLKNPDRLVIDFENSKLSTKTDQLNNHIFKKVRNSHNDQGQLRIVFDLKKAITAQSSKISQKNDKFYLNLQLSGPKIAKKQSKYEDKILKLLDKETGTVKYIIPKKQIAKKPKKRRPIIIIDAGHGGKDPGAIGRYGKTKEKHVTLRYAKELKKELLKTKKFKVFLTRDKDYFIPLRKRVEKSQNLKANLFISLHADSHPNKKTTGLSIYTLSEKSSDKHAAMLAKKENKADIVGGANFYGASGDILKTLINLAQRNTMNESAKFAELAIKVLKSRKVNVLQKTHRFAGFYVLTAPDVPSVLIELGYLSNKYEEKRLNNAYYKKKVVKSLAAAITKYFAK